MNIEGLTEKELDYLVYFCEESVTGPTEGNMRAIWVDGGVFIDVIIEKLKAAGADSNRIRTPPEVRAKMKAESLITR